MDSELPAPMSDVIYGFTRQPSAGNEDGATAFRPPLSHAAAAQATIYVCLYGHAATSVLVAPQTKRGRTSYNSESCDGIMIFLGSCFTACSPRLIGRQGDRDVYSITPQRKHLASRASTRRIAGCRVSSGSQQAETQGG